MSLKEHLNQLMISTPPTHIWSNHTYEDVVSECEFAAQVLNETTTRLHGCVPKSVADELKSEGLTVTYMKSSDLNPYFDRTLVGWGTDN